MYEPTRHTVAGVKPPAPSAASRGPSANRFPHRGDIGPGEPYADESRIVQLIQPQPGIGEVLAGQARILAAGHRIGRLAP